MHAAVALLGAIFLLRRDMRLLLAPPYGAGLLLIEDLAVQAIELREVARVTSEVIAARTGASLLAAAVGACAAGAAALSVRVAPARSVGLTAVGAFVAVAAFAAIVHLARRRYGSTAAGEPPSAPLHGR